MPATSQYRTRRRVEFVDTDMGGIVHFSRFYVFMEQTEHEFLRSLGANPGSYRDSEGRRVGWPRVAASCEFLSPARFGDELDIHLRIVRKGTSSLTYGFDISIGERLRERKVARGQVTTVYCLFEDGIQAIPIPPEVAGLIDQAPS
ncbi:MAG TPA: thioesterase family protein [Thermoanaerobaculia bacterium]|jgi:4-hydroxybenzoyl-CoA thioesterase/acyl-CoA thioester hydrolase|nr:thioesterase family protein [Thermoanaerobaculia bacterium]